MIRIISIIIFILAATIVKAQRPPNDNIANRIVLPSTNYVFTIGSNVGATMEAVESNKVTIPVGNSVWWEWKPPYTGYYIFTTDGSDFDTVLALFIPGSGGSILKIKEDDNGVTPDFVTSTASLFSYYANSNTTYYIAVYGKRNGTNVESGNIELRIQPDNNMFENAIELYGERVQSISWNGHADVETGETYTIGFSYTGKTIWWKWRPPRNGQFLISTIGSTFNTVLGVYQNITKVPSSATAIRDDDSGSPVDLTSLVTLSATTNNVYYIVVDGYQEEEINWAGRVVLSIFPDNNVYTNRTRLYGTNVTDVSANGKATVEPNEIALLTSVVTPEQNPNYKSVWWEWQAPSNGKLTVTTMGSDFDTLLAIYMGESNFFGTGSDIKLLTWDDNSGPPEANFTDYCSLGVIPNRVYKIQVMGNGSDGYGKVVINLTFEPGPPNDMFTNRIVLPSTNKITVYGNNINASSDDNEPLHAGLNSGKSVWWSWTAPETGPVRISTFGSDFDTILAVYTGNTINSLTPVASNNDDEELGGGLTSLVTFPAIKGTTYQIAVDGYKYGDNYDSIDDGHITLSIEQVAAPPNDFFTNRIMLTGDIAVAVGSNLNATKEPNEPNHAGDAGGASVWWAWKPPFSGIATITTEGSEIDTLLGVYTGTSLTNLMLIASNNDADPADGDFSSIVTFYASSNLTYNIAVDGFAGMSGKINLKIVLTTPTKISSAGITPDKNFSLKFQTLPGHLYEIQYSEDLIMWFPLTNFNANGNLSEFIDSTTGESKIRFYRIVEYPY
jgi:hypothetical protein